MNSESESQPNCAYTPKRTYFIRILPEIFKLMFRHGANVAYDVQQGLPGDCSIIETIISPNQNLIHAIFISQQLDEYFDSQLQQPEFVSFGDYSKLYEWNVKLASVTRERAKKQFKARVRALNAGLLCKRCREVVKLEVERNNHE